MKEYVKPIRHYINDSGCWVIEFKELEMEGVMRLTSHLLEESDHAKITAYECE